MVFVEAMGDERLIKPENIQLKDVPEVALEPEPSSSKAAATRATPSARSLAANRRDSRDRA